MIRALEALKRPQPRASSTPTRSTCMKGITSGSTAGSAAAGDRRQEAGEERGPVARARRAARAKHEVEWHWVRGHAGHPENERADALANKGIPGDRMRQIVLDTETTGLNAKLGDRIIEIGCVELLSRRVTERDFHAYLNPEREVELGATRVHGLTREDLAAKPKFAEVARGVPRLRARRRAAHPQRRLRRRVPRHGARRCAGLGTLERPRRQGHRHARARARAASGQEELARRAVRALLHRQLAAARCTARCSTRACSPSAISP